TLELGIDPHDEGLTAALPDALRAVATERGLLAHGARCRDDTLTSRSNGGQIDRSQMAEPGLGVGQVVSGTYRIVRRVGGGGMGRTTRPPHRRLAGRYAIKVLRPEIAADADASARFQREAKVTSALQHPNIVQVVDFNALEGGAPYLVMEFLDGPELAQVMK